MSKPIILTKIENLSINKNKILSDDKEFFLKVHTDRVRSSSYNDNKLSFEIFPDTPEYEAITELQKLCTNPLFKKFNERYFVNISLTPTSAFFNPDNTLIEKVNEKLISKMNDIDILLKPIKYLFKSKEGINLKVIQLRYKQVYRPERFDAILFD